MSVALNVRVGGCTNPCIRAVLYPIPLLGTYIMTVWRTGHAQLRMCLSIGYKARITMQHFQLIVHIIANLGYALRIGMPFCVNAFGWARVVGRVGQGTCLVSHLGLTKVGHQARPLSHPSHAQPAPQNNGGTARGDAPACNDSRISRPRGHCSSACAPSR